MERNYFGFRESAYNWNNINCSFESGNSFDNLIYKRLVKDDTSCVSVRSVHWPQNVTKTHGRHTSAMVIGPLVKITSHWASLLIMILQKPNHEMSTFRSQRKNNDLTSSSRNINCGQCYFARRNARSGIRMRVEASRESVPDVVNIFRQYKVHVFRIFSKNFYLKVQLKIKCHNEKQGNNGRTRR